MQRHQRLRHAERVLDAAERTLRDHGGDEQQVAAPQSGGRRRPRAARTRGRRGARRRRTPDRRAAGRWPAPRARAGGSSRRRSAAPLPSPACRPRRAARARPDAVATSPRTARGTTGTAGPSPSSTAQTSCTASHTNTTEIRKCRPTDHHTSCARTTNPPTTAWVTTPIGCSQARRTSRSLRGRYPHAAIRQSPATSTTTPVSSRLPNSIHCVSASTSGCGVGTRLPGKHSGQVGQPRPEPVTRTIEPVTAIPACATTAAIASARITDRGVGGSRSSSDMLQIVEGSSGRAGGGRSERHFRCVCGSESAVRSIDGH